MMAFPKRNGQAGFALVAALGFILVLTLIGVSINRTIHTDLDYTGHDLIRIRADFAAESAVQWGLTEVLRTDGGKEPLTRGTHDSTGETALSNFLPGGGKNPARLAPEDMGKYEGTCLSVDANGWIVAKTSIQNETFAGGKSEELSFKIWYPNDSIVRITGRGLIDGVTSEINFLSKTRDVLTPI